MVSHATSGRALTAQMARSAAGAVEASVPGRAFARGALTGLIDGSLGGAVGELAMTVTDAETWKRSVWGVLARAGQALLRGGLLGAGTGAVAGGLLEMAQGLLRARAAVPGTSRGGRGDAIAWEGFDESLAGGPVRELSTRGIRVTARGVDAVEQHLARFGSDRANRVMLDRLRRIQAGELAATPQDLNFYTHELREFVRYRRLGFASSVPANADDARNLWLQTHSASLADYGLPLQADELLYHSDAARYLYE
jgi:hypothetical protein